MLETRHPRIVVFAGAFCSHVVMSILPTALRYILPAFVPKKWPLFAGAMRPNAARMLPRTYIVQLAARSCPCHTRTPHIITTMSSSLWSSW